MSSGGLCIYRHPDSYDRVKKADTAGNTETIETLKQSRYTTMDNCLCLSHILSSYFLFVFRITCDNWEKNINQY